jgi:ADP-ribose pyrophosphatase
MGILYRGKYLTLLDEDGWEFVHRPASHGVVSVVAEFDGALLLVEQYRYAHGAPVIALPGGLVDEDPANPDYIQNAARRELLEETGFAADKMIPLANGPVSPGMTTEKVTVLLASGLQQVMQPAGDGDEVLKLHAVPKGQIFAWLDRKKSEGALIDIKLYVGLALIGLIPPAT